MHEMGIALQIIDIATASIPEKMKPAHVESILLRVGKLSAVIPDNLRFCFEVASKGTAVEGAALRIEEVPVVARCRACGCSWTLNGPAFRCEACGSGNIEVISGRELDIVSIELEEGSDFP
uniref:Hydrogenase maturation factor HypA n=1 Tax=Desulfatirhabdium butyrativorans TaxID=340467 RepID=A0A7C4MPV7_9BACT